MTIGGAIAELQNLLDADDVPFYYKGGIEKIIETIQMEMTVRKDEPQPNATQRTQHVESVEPIRLDDDGTLWVTVEDCDKVGRVIVESGTWCKTFGEPMRWIPCSERLPDDDTLMLVNYIDNRPEAMDIWIGWHEMENVWYIDGEAHSKEYGNEVIAWMPLPKPYKGGAE